MEFLHVGMMVSDIDRSIAFYRDVLGIKWEPVKEYRLEGGTFRGEPAEPSRTLVSHGLTPSGVEIEMVQALEGQIPDHLALGRRQGLSHIAFTVDNLDEAAALLEARGLKNVAEHRADTHAYAFFQGDALGGPLVQLVELKGPRSLNIEP